LVQTEFYNFMIMFIWIVAMAAAKIILEEASTHCKWTCELI